MILKGESQVLSQFSQYCSMVLSRNPARSSHYPSVPVEMQVHFICLWRPGARRPAWRGPEPSVANSLSLRPRSFHPRENLAKLVRKEGREPNKEMQPETGRSLPLGAFRLALLLAPKLVMRREAAAYPQAMHAMWHFGCKAVRTPLGRSTQSRRPS